MDVQPRPGLKPDSQSPVGQHLNLPSPATNLSVGARRGAFNTYPSPFGRGAGGEGGTAKAEGGKRKAATGDDICLPSPGHHKVVDGRGVGGEGDLSWLQRLRPQTGYDWVRMLVALVLLIAAGLKCHQLTTKPFWRRPAFRVPLLFIPCLAIRSY
jgi:hypothetical protein